MLIRIKTKIWQRPINSEQGVSYWACTMASWPKIRFSGFGYWKAPLLPLRPLRKDFSNELGHTYVEALTVLGCQKNGHGHGYGNFRAPWHPGVDMFQIKPASTEMGPYCFGIRRVGINHKIVRLKCINHFGALWSLWAQWAPPVKGKSLEGVATGVFFLQFCKRMTKQLSTITNSVRT